MKRTMLFGATMCAALVGMMLSVSGCDEPYREAPKSASGVRKAEVEVKTGSDGLTVEQRNVQERVKRDNTPGSIKHLYVISAYSGDVLVYSTVRGKVTSSQKRLTPGSVAITGLNGETYGGFPILIGGKSVETSEVLGDDGAYGSSSDYLYWFDTKGVYHQHWVTGGQILHISDEPLAVKKVVLNMELRNE